MVSDFFRIFLIIDAQTSTRVITKYKGRKTKQQLGDNINWTYWQIMRITWYWKKGK